MSKIIDNFENILNMFSCLEIAVFVRFMMLMAGICTRFNIYFYVETPNDLP